MCFIVDEKMVVVMPKTSIVDYGNVGLTSDELFICRLARSFVSFADKNSFNLTKSNIFWPVGNLTLSRRLVLRFQRLDRKKK